MKFEDYARLYNCNSLQKTEQSWAFTATRDGTKRVVKTYPTKFDQCREELSYAYINSRNLLNILKLNMVEEDFIEMDFLESIGSPSNLESIQGIANMYQATKNNSHPKGYFPKIDLSKDKLFKRLEYIPKELEKRGFSDSDLIKKSEHFVNNFYDPSPHQCLVHGDLKSVHIIKTTKGISFIDLALVSIANPWYDLAFLYMEKNPKEGFLNILENDTFTVLGNDFNINRKEVNHYLMSAIFYRSLYDVGFAARHRNDKPLIRIIKNLKDLLSIDK